MFISLYLSSSVFFLPQSVISEVTIPFSYCIGSFLNSPPKITHLLLGEENDISDGWTGQTYILYTKRCLEDQSDLEIEVCIGGDQEILVMANY